MTTDATTVGTYLAARLREIGLQHYFAVPGDYNLVLLDELLREPGLRMIGCCNELNAGYAADGYARSSGGASAVVVTFTVGGLSLINAVAGAYAEDLPVIAISGGPNTNSEAEDELLHHTLGEVSYRYMREMYSRVTAESVVIHHPSLAPSQIDRAIETALRRRKPVYLEIACNIAGAVTSAPQAREFRPSLMTDPRSLDGAVEATLEMLSGASKPALLAGVKMRPAGAVESFRRLAEASGFAVATMPNAKGFFPEHHPQAMGIYWGPVSDTGCSEIIEAADVCIAAGPTLTDYTTCGHELGLESKHLITVRSDAVELPTRTFTNVRMTEYLDALSERVTENRGALTAYERVRPGPVEPPQNDENGPLSVRQLFDRIQGLLDGDSTLLVETGDSWFNGMDLRLPDGARFEIQLQYGSIGWSVGATLGASLGAEDRRVVACIGDGSFQMTAQEISTMIRYAVNPIIFLINNRGYTIEVEIHDGPYNTIKNWDYARLVDVFNAEDGGGWSASVTTARELDAAIETARTNESVSFIEVAIDRDDCNRNLLRWGNRVAHNNARPPRGI